jgi:hypothetical protein
MRFRFLASPRNVHAKDHNCLFGARHHDRISGCRTKPVSGRRPLTKLPHRKVMVREIQICCASFGTLRILYLRECVPVADVPIVNHGSRPYEVGKQFRA